MSAHFNVLREADLVEAEKDGKSVIYHLKLSVLEDALMGFANTFGLGTEPRASKRKAAMTMNKIKPNRSAAHVRPPFAGPGPLVRRGHGVEVLRRRFRVINPFAQQRAARPSMPRHVAMNWARRLKRVFGI